jgi:hypothetical protein
MGELRIHHRVALKSSSGGEGTLVFKCWLPGPENPIAFELYAMRVAVTVDKSCVDAFEEVTDELISRWGNIRVRSVLIDVIVSDVDDDMCDFIATHYEWPKTGRILESEDPEVRLRAEVYSELGQRVLAAVLRGVNRLSSWASAEHGQYWLAGRGGSTDSMMSNNNEFDAVVFVNGGAPVRWCPPNRDAPITIYMHTGVELEPGDWGEATDFVSSEKRPDATGEILANARTLIDAGYFRSAVIEAVAALELATNRFAQHPTTDMLRHDRYFTGDSFTAELKHLGFTATVRHLLPLVFKPEMLDGETLAKADSAIDCRHRIVHGAQRDVDEAVARRHVHAAGKVIEILQRATRRAF